jgi:2,3-bisphosphoglycerate-independent phosphoglycerate mutase
MDGWGLGKSDYSDAIAQAKTPFYKHMLQSYPNARLEASGGAVGLPAGQMGNSEVGHMNLGAGRIVYQELGRINKAVQDGDLANNPVLTEAFAYAKKEGKNVHFIGLLSDGGVHAHIDHVKGLCDAAKANGLTNVFIHAFLDGRDTDPKSGLGFIHSLNKHLKTSVGTLASAVGRYYAMDRDNRWERVKLAYDLLVKGQGKACTNIADAVEQSYNEGITDEFMPALVGVDAEGKVLTHIAENDVVICFNFRTDRGREITQALTQRAFPEQQMQPLALHYITFTSYDETFKNVQVIFHNEDLKDTLGEVLSQNHKNQIRIAETEKYPHVTFFFSGGREAEFPQEKRKMAASPKVATYDLQPEMSAAKLAEIACEELGSGWPDFMCLNFANPDMVGHTGVFEAVVKAVETVDNCVKEVVECGLENGYSFIILADHGNADFMVNADGTPNTAHTTNLVPCILIDSEFTHIKDGKLGDIAPSLLKLMHLPIPPAMTGTVLVS